MKLVTRTNISLLFLIVLVCCFVANRPAHAGYYPYTIINDLSVDSFPLDKQKEFLPHSYSGIDWGKDALKSEVKGALLFAVYSGAVSFTMHLAGDATKWLVGQPALTAVQLMTYGLADYMTSKSWSDFMLRSSVNVASTALAPYDSILAYSSRFLLSQLWLLGETLPDIKTELSWEFHGSTPIRFMNPVFNKLFQLEYSLPDINTEIDTSHDHEVPGVEILFLESLAGSYLTTSGIEQRLIQLHRAGRKSDVKKITLYPQNDDSYEIEADVDYQDGSRKQAVLPCDFGGNQRPFWWTEALMKKQLEHKATYQKLLSPMTECSLNQLLLFVSGSDELPICRYKTGDQYSSKWKQLSVVSAGDQGFWLFDNYHSQGYELPEIWLSTQKPLGKKYQEEVDELEWWRKPPPGRGIVRLVEEGVRSLAYHGISALLVSYLNGLSKATVEKRTGAEVIPDTNLAGMDRFVAAQDKRGLYPTVLGELRRGKKVTCCFWFIFPQLSGFGTSNNSKYFGIVDAEEARNYLAHPELGRRLRECAQILLGLEKYSAVQIFGPLDAQKLQSSMTLFEHVADDPSVFSAVLKKYFGNVRDQETLRRLL